MASARSTPLAFLLSILVALAEAANTALSVTPSTNWYGYDGDWSAISLRIGQPEQWVDVLPNTQSSETWVVGIGGCEDNSLCESNRGNIFNSSSSSTWLPLGFFELGVNEGLGNDGYASYGLDRLTFGSTGATLSSAIVGMINSTDNWLGSFGLGTIPGSFNGKSLKSALSALVEDEGVSQSHSYGYTAGARYRQKGVATSLTLGGYDLRRLVPHTVSFAMNPSQQPQAYINEISVVSANTSSPNWTTQTQLLSSSDRVSAIVDSSTPYLWLPQTVCNVFAEQLGLSYNSSLNLYTFDSNPAQHEALQSAQLTFTFRLSDLSTSSESVNITLPYDAFDLQLTFPAIPNTTYGSEDSTKYYFPLRQATNEAQFRIGRAFLQEAYLITNYERNTWSLHQALHPSDAITNTSIIPIPRDALTTFSGPPSNNKKLTTGAIAGIVIGVLALIILLSAVVFWCCRRKGASEDHDEKGVTSTQRRRTFDRFLRRRGSPPVHEANGSSTYATEVGADASHERFELPAPLGPVELDSEMGTLAGSRDYSSTENTDNMSAYEIARRKLERQQAGTRDQAEKTEHDVSHVAHYRPSDSNFDPPLVSPLEGGSDNSMSLEQPSPLTPGFGSQEGFAPPTYRRINPANVVYAGRLPGNVQLPHNIPKVVGRDGQTIRSEGSDPPVSTPTSGGDSTLGSQYTANEMIDLYGDSSGNMHAEVSPFSNETGSGSGKSGRLGRSTAAREPRDDAQLQEYLDPVGSRTRLDGEDLIHVPQLAERRFSWEEERISGNGNTL